MPTHSYTSKQAQDFVDQDPRNRRIVSMGNQRLVRDDSVSGGVSYMPISETPMSHAEAFKIAKAAFARRA